MLVFWVQFSGTNFNWCLDDTAWEVVVPASHNLNLSKGESNYANELLVIWYLCDLWFSHLDGLQFTLLWRILVCQDLGPSTLSFLSPDLFVGCFGLSMIGMFSSLNIQFLCLNIHAYNTYTFFTWSCKTCNFNVGAQSFRNYFDDHGPIKVTHCPKKQKKSSWMHHNYLN